MCWLHGREGNRVLAWLGGGPACQLESGRRCWYREFVKTPRDFRWDKLYDDEVREPVLFAFQNTESFVLLSHGNVWLLQLVLSSFCISPC